MAYEDNTDAIAALMESNPAQAQAIAAQLKARRTAAQQAQSAAQQALESANAPMNTSGIEAYAKRKGANEGRSLLMALAANEAGNEFKPMSQHFYGRAGQDAGPEKFTGGTATREGWVNDPGYGHQAGISRAQARANSADAEMARVQGAEERAALQAERLAAQRQLQQDRFAEQRSLRATIAAAAAANRPAPAAPTPPKPTKAQELEEANKVRGGEVLELLDQAEKHLQRATSSYIGNAADKLARTVGMSTEGSKATAALGTIAGQILAKMPRMEGPQSNYDVALYSKMAGQLDDPTLPIGDRAEALKTLRELNAKYAPGAKQGAATPAPADFNSLPKRSK